MEHRQQRAQEILSIRERLGNVDFGTAQQTVPRNYSAAYETAAVLSSFGDDEFDFDSGLTREVLQDSLAFTAGNTVRYVLDPDVRRRVLRQIGSRERMQEILGSVSNLPEDPTQSMISSIIETGEAVDEDSASLSTLQTAFRTLNWFGPNVVTQAPETIRARIEKIGFLDRFERLVGDNFRNRHDELDELRRYVGVLRDERGLLARVLDRPTSFTEKPAFMLTGPGGIGKSTLLAKFVLDHASATGDDQFPFAYINFDSPTVRADAPRTILSEALRQLEIQYPEYGVTLSTLRDRWAAELIELSRMPDSTRRKRDRELTIIFRQEFVKLLSSIGVDERPVLLILDTFEVVQERQHGDIATLLEFLNDLQGDTPALRVVISGRGRPKDDAHAATSVITDAHNAHPIRVVEHPLGGLDRDTSTAYLEDAGLRSDHAAEVAQYLIPDEAIEEGASPLSLRVAAEIWRRDLERHQLDTEFWAQLRAGRIQAQLITRYVRHTDPTSTAGRLAVPSLLLQRVTPDALLNVVAPAWDVPLSTDELDDTFTELSRLISLVIERGGSVLEPRPEVQRQIVELISDLERRQVAELHDRAVEYFAKRSERPDLDPGDRSRARFDEIVHRLARNDDPQLVRTRWEPVCAEHLAGRIEVLSIPAQAFLDQLAGIDLTTSARRTVSLDVWQVEAAKQAEAALADGRPERVIEIASERSDWDRSSDLALQLSCAHLALGDPLEALEVASSALRGARTGLASGLVADLNQVAAEAAHELTRPLDVLDYLDDALVIARQREDELRLASALLLRLAVIQDRNEVASALVVDELDRLLSALTAELPTRDVLRLFGLVERFPQLVRAAVLHGGFDLLTPTSARRLARTLSEFDRAVSARLEEPLGLVALSAGLSVGSGEAAVTRTWERALIKGGPNAVAAVSRALAFEEPMRAELVATLATHFGTIARDSQPSDVTTVSNEEIALNSRRRRRLAAILLEAVGLEQLTDIVASEFDISLSSLASLDVAPESVMPSVIETALRDRWLGALIVAIRNRMPDSPPLLSIANELDLSTIHYSSKRLQEVAGEENIDIVLGSLGKVEGRIARIELNESLVSTGVLVSPDLLLLAGSTLDRITPAQRVVDLTARFGLKADGKGRRHDQGILFPTFGEALVDRFTTQSGCELALLRLDGSPADEPLGNSRGQFAHERRGFLELSDWSEPVEGQNALICWQQLARLELRVERRALRRVRNALGPKLQNGLVIPSPGLTAEGAPVFDRTMRFLGITLRSQSGVARIVPGEELWLALVERGHGGTIGVALA
ncbi:MAG: ATP-binding protein [Acidimicrobiia bacterium]|nr:ATP-binding protein [Acidimicrobiia bacterium]